jgi:NADH-quinone oxidoreductase subunit M
MQDLSPREMAILAPLCALMIWIGWNPTPVLERMEPSVRAVIERVEEAGRVSEVTVEFPVGGDVAAEIDDVDPITDGE